jgi:molybdate transport system substrate-binding protein
MMQKVSRSWSRSVILAQAGMTAAALLPMLLVAGSACAAEVRVLTTGAFKPIVTALVPDFERRSGDTVVVVNDTAGALARRVEGSEAFDLLVLTPQALADLTQKGRVAAGTTVPLARVGIGVAVKEGAPRPDIGTVEAFRRALLDAPSIAMIDPAAGGSSGIYLAGLFERLGIADAVKAKAVLVPGGLVAERVVTGQAALAVHQISEILAVKGAALVGPLPADIQNYTVYAGGIGAAARQPEAARNLLNVLAGEAARSVLTRKGMEPPNG